MEPHNLTDYERRRLENIKRNDEMMAALKIQSRLSELSPAQKRQRTEKKTYKTSPQKKPKPETPVVIRRSLRNRGIAPDSAGLKDDFLESSVKPSKYKFPTTMPKPSSPRVLGPLPMKEAYSGSGSDEALINTIMDASVSDKDVSCCGSENASSRLMGSVDIRKLRLDPENIARVVPGRIFDVKFFPTTDMTMVVVGNKFGNVGFWDVKSKGEDGDGIYLYNPHSAPVSGFSIQPFSISKMYSSSYDGLLRLMDVEKQVFDLVYSSDDALFSVSQPPNDVNSVYFSEGPGTLNIWDSRAGKVSATWSLHEHRINTIDFNAANTNLMATSSTGGAACVWDLRKMDADEPVALQTISHKRAVQSAYFSPSGTRLATTSYDNTIGVLGGANFEDTTMIRHDNQTGRWISPFRATWGWDDSYIYVGNMKRGVDILSESRKNTVFTLQSAEMSAIPCRLDAHPCKVGMLAGATSGGQVYIWEQNK